MTTASPSLSDEALALQTQSGSMEAFEELVVRYEHRIFGFVSRSCRNPADACEITQEIFVKAFQAIGQFDPTRIFAPWLFTIARRKCIDYFRTLKDRSHQHLQPETQAEHHSERPDSADPAELLARQDERRNLWGLARRILPDPQFNALWLHYVEDMSVAEIAKILRRPQTYVKVLLFRGRKSLAQRLKPTTCAEVNVSIGNDAAFLPSKTLPSAYEINVR